VTTRRQDPEARTFRQEAFASSAERERGVLGNLVAARCCRLEDREEVAVLWWLQQISWREGGIAKFAAEIVEENQAAIGTESMQRFGMKPGQVYKAEQVRAVRSEFPLQFGFELNEKFPLRGEVPPAGMSELLEYESLDEIESRRIKAQSYPTSYPVEAFKEECALSGSELSTVLQRAMLDPGAESLRVGLWNFPSLWNALLARREREVSAARGAIIETDIAGKVFEELDFALETRSFVLIEGREGIGKSEAAKNWAARHPGRAIYVRLESGSDEASLFRCNAIRLLLRKSVTAPANKFHW